jgi:hypothetical protein
MPLPLQHEQTLTGRDSHAPCDRVAFGKKHPLGAFGLPDPAEPALHETRLNLGLQSTAPPPIKPA